MGLDLHEVLEQLQDGRFFTVAFFKKDGEFREMTCRLGVKKYLKGGQLKYDAKAKNNLIVFDVTKQAYRTIPFDRLCYLKANKQVLYSNENIVLKMPVIKALKG